MDEFYYFSRTCMVKDEKYFDRFDQAFGLHFKDLEALDDVIEALIPDDWLRPSFLKICPKKKKKKLNPWAGWKSSSRNSKSDWKSRKSATRAVTSGLAPAAPRRSARKDTILKAFG